MKRLLLSFAVLSAAFLPAPADGAEVRSYVGGNFTLEIDGVQAGFLYSVADLGFTRIVDGRVVARGVPTTVELRLGFASRSGLEWIASSLGGRAPANLRLVSRDYKFDAIEQYDLPSFAFDELQIPACDGAVHREPAFLRVRGLPTGVTEAVASGKAEATKIDDTLWLPRDFRVTLAGVEMPKVSSVGPIDVRRGPQGFEVAPFDVVIPETHAEVWETWAEKAIVRGETDERTLKLELLSSDRKSVLARFELTGVTPLAFQYAQREVRNADLIRRRTYTLAAKGIKMTVPKPLKDVKKPGK